MPSKTTLIGYTIPTVSDDLAALVGAVQQGFRDIENFLYLPVDSKNASAAHDSYPVGISLLPLGAGTPATGWPDTTGVALVITIRRGNTANGALQFWAAFSSATTPTIKVRTGASTGWGDFRIFASPNLPNAMASGQVTGSAPATGGTVALNVVLPANVFATSPRITLAAQSSLPNQLSYSYGNVSSTSFTIYLYRTGDTSTSISWIAVQGVEE